MATISYLEYSNRDAVYAKGNFEMGYYDPCGRFCQQSIEKRLKHYIELHGGPEDLKFLQTHSLGRLYSKVCDLADVPTDLAFRGELSQLTDYYFDTNYPQDINIELDEDMAKDSLRVLDKAIDWIDTVLLGEEG